MLITVYRVSEGMELEKRRQTLEHLKDSELRLARQENANRERWTDFSERGIQNHKDLLRSICKELNLPITDSLLLNVEDGSIVRYDQLMGATNLC